MKLSSSISCASLGESCRTITSSIDTPCEFGSSSMSSVSADPLRSARSACAPPWPDGLSERQARGLCTRWLATPAARGRSGGLRTWWTSRYPRGQPCESGRTRSSCRAAHATYRSRVRRPPDSAGRFCQSTPATQRGARRSLSAALTHKRAGPVRREDAFGLGLDQVHDQPDTDFRVGDRERENRRGAHDVFRFVVGAVVCEQHEQRADGLCVLIPHGAMLPPCLVKRNPGEEHEVALASRQRDRLAVLDRHRQWLIPRYAVHIVVRVFDYLGLASKGQFDRAEQVDGRHAAPPPHWPQPVGG
eukprot:scaffold56744_cov66-Phaeocystis_antarctica.AAC.3